MGFARGVAVGAGVVLTLAIGGGAVAQERQVYRYLDADGRVVYSDRAPTSGAKDLQTKRVTANTISTSEVSLAVQQATERFPVTLFTFPCGPACENALALLNRRGVPFATVSLEEAEGQQRVQQVTGELSAPVLQVGDKLIAKGWNEGQWNALLDQAGYPKSPPRRSGPSQRPLDEAVPAQPVTPTATPTK